MDSVGGLYVCARSPYCHGVDLLIAAIPGGAQTIYKSIGPDGTPTYGDKPPANGKIERTYEFVELPSSSLPVQAAPSGVIHGPQAEHNQGSGVVLYSAAWCGYCKRAHAYLAQKGIAYQDVDIETPAGRAAFANAGGSAGYHC